MIAYIEGTLLSLELDSCVLLTRGGVGYEVFLSTRSRAALPAPGVIYLKPYYLNLM